MTLQLRFSVGEITADTSELTEIVATDVPLQLVRVASGTASTLLTGAVPLAPGDLPSGGVCSLWVGGSEVSANLTTVGLPHADGSARAVRVQHTRSMTNGSDVAAVLKLGTAQTLSASYTAPTINTMTTTSWQTQTPMDGVIVSTDSARTCASGLLGPLSVRPTSIPGTPSWLATVESRWDSVHDAKHSQYDGSLVAGGYGQYDPAYQNLVRWARTGSVSAFLQAIRVYGIRRVQWVSDAWIVPQFLMHQQGLAAMAILLDDGTARTESLSRVLDQFCYTDRYAWINTVVSSSDIGDARTAASTLWSLIAADRMGDGLVTQNGWTIREWVRQWALRTIGKGQWVTEASGQESYKSQTDTIGNPGSGTPAWSNNFQNGLLCDALAAVLDGNYVTDSGERASIQAKITNCMEWMWQTQFFPSGTPSPYQSLASRAVTGYTSAFPEPAVDVGGLWLGAIMWLAQNVNRSTWQTRADVLLDVIGRSPMNGADAPYMDPSTSTNVTGKVCNETFLYMGRTLAWRA